MELRFLKVQVINETVRLANIVPGIFRKTLRETKFKGVDQLSLDLIIVCVCVCVLYLYLIDGSETRD